MLQNEALQVESNTRSEDAEVLETVFETLHELDSIGPLTLQRTSLFLVGRPILPSSLADYSSRQATMFTSVPTHTPIPISNMHEMKSWELNLAHYT
jgi:hypothetical protein